VVMPLNLPRGSTLQWDVEQDLICMTLLVMHHKWHSLAAVFGI